MRLSKLRFDPSLLLLSVLVTAGLSACATRTASAPPSSPPPTPATAPAEAAPPPFEVRGPALPFAAPEEVGMSPEALEHLETSMRALVDEGKVPHLVTLVARRGKIVHWRAMGLRDVAADDPIAHDDVFRIYSMSKPVTSVAVMMLVERGVLSLDDPVSKFIPAFADAEVMEEDGSLRPAERPMTVRHLLTHTSGLTYGVFSNTSVDKLYLSKGLFQSPDGQAFVDTLGTIPLLVDPGERWIYGVSTDVLGHVVEVASGQSFAEFLRENVFDPLGMDDTTFQVPTERLDDFAGYYQASDDGLVPAALDGKFTEPPTLVSGGGGLLSTASDYVRFCQMLLEGGSLDGVRVLEEETVRAMGSNQLPPELTPLQTRTMPPAYGFGFGFAVLLDPSKTEVDDHAGLLRWGGYANTFFWIDPEAELIAMVWTQYFPYMAHGIEPTFQKLVYDAISE